MKKRSLLVAVLVINLVILATFNDKSIAAMLTYSFDDGHISVYSKAYPILANYGQVGTANVISNTVRMGTWHPNFVDSAQLFEMQNAGWEICSHSKTHPHFSKIPQTYNDELLNGWTPVSGTNYTYKTNYTYEELPFTLQNGTVLRKKQSIEEVDSTCGSVFFDSDAGCIYVHTTDSSNPLTHEIRADSVQRELEMSKIELTEMGLDIQNFIVPYSDWSENRRELAMEYYNSVGAGYHDGWVNDIPPEDSYWLVRISQGSTLEEIQGRIEEAIDEDKWLILMLHCIGDDGYSEEKLNTLAEWVSSLDIQVVTQQEGLELAAVPIPPSFILFLSGLGVIFGGLNFKEYKKC